MSIKRYVLVSNEFHEIEPLKRPHGDWVRYEDVEKDMERIHYLMRMLVGKGNTSRTRREARKLVDKYKEKK